jgi:tetratricopeptide (TPR) repeat protein
MAVCYKQLQQWNEAIACHNEGVELSRDVHGPNHPSYATALCNLAALYLQLKRFEEAVPRFEEALAIQQKVFGNQHKRTIDTGRCLAVARKLASERNRGKVQIETKHRMCDCCGLIKEGLYKCACQRAWYCNEECQNNHWEQHMLNCNICSHCEDVKVELKQCSRCHNAKYCDAECQNKHCAVHKLECKK